VWAAGVAREGKDEKTAATEAVGCMLTAGREGTVEILGYTVPHGALAALIGLLNAAVGGSSMVGSCAEYGTLTWSETNR